MDPWFHSYFSALCVLKSDNEWQDFVSQAMTAKHGPAFLQVDASYRGDWGCDGYVGGLMLACYGARRPTESGVLDKVVSDFGKAQEHWGSVMTRWAFVHNNADGLPKMAADAIIQLRKTNERNLITIESWPPQILWQECVEGLSEERLIPLIGAPPSARPAGMSYIAEALRSLARTARLPQVGEVKPVPEKKIEHNKFSPATEEIIRKFQVDTHLVRYYFERATPGEQAQVSHNLKMRYDALAAKFGNSDAVFHGLVNELLAEAFTADYAHDLEEQKNAAVLIITHFFESCLIFEEPNK